jgi:hypothetical protein
VVHQSKGLVLASWRCVSFNVWRRAMDTQGIRTAKAHLRDMRARFPAGYVSMVLFPEQGRDIKLEIAESLRAEVSDIVRESAGAVRASAILLEGGGFFAATMRTAGSGIVLLTRPEYPVKFHESLDAACAWLAPYGVTQSGAKLSTSELTAAARAAVAVAG